uniref:Putative ovule protein n=2 Tax=Solanum chacoense TaxID=4108 RepID=A0A0V0HUD1_SOLCH
MTTTPRHHEKKTSASLDTSHCKYPLRNKQLKEVKLEKTNAEEDLLYVAQKAMRKKANNAKLEKGDVEERSKAGDPSASTTTNQHNEKKTTTPLDASHCRYPLRSKQHIEVKLEQWETGGNMHNKTPKNKVVADSPYCIRQNLCLPASSPSYQPVRVKLEKPDNLFCAAEKVKGRETNNVKLDTGDLEGNLIAASYKGKDSTASEMTVLGKKKMLPSEKHNRDMYFNPHFTVSMQPTCVSRNFQLDIPVEFFKKCLNEEETIVNLRVSNGRSWRAKLLDIQSNCPKMESSGWRDFVLDNNLKEHDTCVFELIDGIEPMLDVTIFRATTPIS